jgi:phytoene synthase
MAESNPPVTVSLKPASKALHELPEKVQRSFEYCHTITKTRARNFYYGLKLTPEPRRSAGYAVYAFMRACDDLVDSPVVHGVVSATPTPEEGLARIETFRAAMLEALSCDPDKSMPEGEFWPAFRYAVDTYRIETQLLHDMLDGQKCDLTKTTYDNFDELYDYCYKVASVVGLVCIRIWGAGHNKEAHRLAKARGIALQLTNILRDLKEDAQRDRVYLPADELAQFKVDPAYFKSESPAPSPEFDALMAFQLQRAQAYYDESKGLETFIDTSCRGTCWALMEIYHGLLVKMKKDPRCVLSKRVRLSSLGKVGIALRAKYGKPWT